MTSKHFAVVGSPIDHSLSPKIHTAAYYFLGLDWDYTRFKVEEGNLKSFLESEGSELSGVSVTMPLKIEAASLASSGDEIVDQLGIANTLLRQENQYLAFNTDVFGIEMALENTWGSQVKHVAILGAGATAQSALYAVSRRTSDAQVFVYARDHSKTQAIQSLASKLDLALEVRSLDSYSNQQDLTISTIPASSLDGLGHHSQSGWLLNVNYASRDSNLSKQFNSAMAIQGETMLIWQAIAQIRIFVSGSPEMELADESALFAKMANAL